MKSLLFTMLALVLALSLSVTAMASTDIDQDALNKNAETTVEFQVAPTYTVTIPKSVTLDKDLTDGTYKQQAAISADNVRLLEGQTIKVTLASDFTMNADSTTWAYTVKVGGSDTLIENGDTVATFETNPDRQSVTLHFAAENPTYAGDYADIVIFTLSVEP